MPALPPRFTPNARACRAALLWLAPLLALAGCGGTSDEKFAPACPQPSIPRDLNDLTRFRGAGRDLTDTVLDARITGLSGKCERNGTDAVLTTVSVGIELTRGPAAASRTAELAYFVAVSEGERILDKRVFNLRAEFPSNTDRLRLSGDDVELRLPVSATKTAAAYRVSVGFQLTPAEIEVNRRRGRR